MNMIAHRELPPTAQDPQLRASRVRLSRAWRTLVRHSKLRVTDVEQAEPIELPAVPLRFLWTSSKRWLPGAA